MRIFLLHGTREQGPLTWDELRDHLDLRMIPPDQPCRVAGLDGTYVAGELVTGHLFRGWEPEDDPEDDAEETDEPDDDAESDAADDPGGETGPENPEDEESGDDTEIGESEELFEIDEDDEDEESDLWDMDPLWEGRPGYSAYPGQITFLVALAAAATLAWFTDWSGWLPVALGALFCLALGLLIGRRRACRYVIYQRRLEWTQPGFLGRTREIPRSSVHSMNLAASFPGRLLGRADLLIDHDHPGVPSPVVFRQIARAHKVRQLWRS